MISASVVITMSQEEIIINNGILLTMNEQQELIKNGGIKICNGIIEEVSTKPLKKDSTTDRIIDASNTIILPGLINAHAHAPTTLLRGIADDVDLMTWLNKFIWPMESKFQPEDVEIASKLAIAEMIRTGTTTFLDMYFHEENVINAIIETGIRGVVSYGMIDLAGKDFDDEKRKTELNVTRELLRKWYGKHERVHVMIGPHAPYTCSPELIKEANELSKKYAVPLNMHVAETRKELEIIKDRYGIDGALNYLDDLGVVSNNLIAVHSVHLSDSEIKLAREKNINVVTCTTSNLKLASGVPKIYDLIKNDVNVAIGTDGAASNNSLDMFREMKFMNLVQKGFNMNPVAISAKKTVEMATINGAKAAGLNSMIGSIEVGKRADITIVDASSPWAQPPHDPWSMIVYTLQGLHVKHVIIDGNIVLEEGSFVSLNVEEIKQEFIQAVERLKREAFS